MPRRPSPDVLDAWRSLLRVHATATTALDADLRRDHGLPIEQYDVLVQLAEHGGRLRMHELADATLFTRSSCTRLVDRLRDRGLVTREPDPEDRRGRFAVLTTEGRDALRRAARTHLAGIDGLLGPRLTTDDAATLAEVLGRLASALGRGQRP